MPTYTVANSEFSQISKVDFIAKIVNRFKLLITFAKKIHLNYLIRFYKTAIYRHSLNKSFSETCNSKISKKTLVMVALHYKLFYKNECIAIKLFIALPCISV